MCWLDLQGRIIRWTDEATSLYSRTEEEAIGAHFSELFTAEDRSRGTPEKILTSTRATGAWDDVGWRSAGNHAFWAATSVTLVRTPNGVEIGHMVVTRSLASLADAAALPVDEGAHRLLSLGRVADTISHDVSNILTAIKGFAGLLERDLPPGGLSHQVWFELLKACDRGTELTAKALKMGRVERDDAEVVDLGQALRDSEALLRQLLPRGIDFAVIIDDELPCVRACKADLELAIMNLVVNARDAIDGEGRVVVEASRECHPGVSTSCRVVVSVRDDGCGMKEKVQEKAFERFFTTKREDGGTGIGLAIVQETIQAMGGTVEIESGPGKGTSVRLLLLADEATRPRAPMRDLKIARRVLGPKILVSCECEVLGGCVSDFMTRERFTLVRATSQAQATALMLEFDDEIALVITDLVRPGTTGPRLMEAVRSDGPGPRALFIAGHSEEAQAAVHTVEPGDRVLFAPFSPDQLRSTVREVLQDVDPELAASIH